MSTGLFIGRFQPFHRGHLATVKYALKKVDALVIVRWHAASLASGSSGASGPPGHLTSGNPDDSR